MSRLEMSSILSAREERHCKQTGSLAVFAGTSATNMKEFAATQRCTRGEGFAVNNAHAGSRTRVTSMGGLYDAATLHAPCSD